MGLGLGIFGCLQVVALARVGAKGWAKVGWRLGWRLG